MRGIRRKNNRSSRSGGRWDMVTVPPIGLVQVQPDHLRVGQTWTSTIAVSGFPPEVGMSWLEPLTTWPGVLDVAVHVDPIPAQSAAAGCGDAGSGWSRPGGCGPIGVAWKTL